LVEHRNAIKPPDAHRLWPPNFKVGNKVFVKAKFFRTTRPMKKLSEKYFGPFEIIAQAGTLSFTLQLPNSMRAVHPVFHVSMLEPHTDNTIPNGLPPPPEPIDIDGEIEYEIDRILDSKINRRCRTCPLLYKVLWTGYEGTDEESSWLTTAELDHVAELIEDFHKAYPAKPGPLSAL
jgi:hypothetical protein